SGPAVINAVIILPVVKSTSRIVCRAARRLPPPVITAPPTLEDWPVIGSMAGAEAICEAARSTPSPVAARYSHANWAYALLRVLQSSRYSLYALDHGRMAYRSGTPHHHPTTRLMATCLICFVLLTGTLLPPTGM